MGGETGRVRTESDLTPWRTARGAGGRMAPLGFPRDNRFGQVTPPPPPAAEEGAESKD
jgi:topoisomerase-4 subunit A